MNSQRAKASIVIRCYNEDRHIGRLLDGIMQQTYRNLEILLVDSGSTDRTLSIAARYPVRMLSIPPEQFSFGRSLNLGCEAAQGEYLVFASAHVYPVFKDWLERMLAPFQDPKIALVYGKQRGAPTTKYSEHQIFAKWFPEAADPHQTHPFCNNANAAVRRSLWQQQPYDETLTGLEDLDWAQRVLSLGYKLAYVPEAGIIHVHDETLRRIYNRYRREAIALKRIYPNERMSFGEFLHLLSANIVSDIYHARHDRALWGNFGSILGFRFMQFFGSYRGFRQRGPVSGRLKHTFYYPRQRHRLEAEETPEQQRRVDYDRRPAEEQVGRNH